MNIDEDADQPETVFECTVTTDSEYYNSDHYTCNDVETEVVSEPTLGELCHRLAYRRLSGTPPELMEWLRHNGRARPVVSFSDIREIQVIRTIPVTTELLKDQAPDAEAKTAGLLQLRVDEVRERERREKRAETEAERRQWERLNLRFGK